MPIKRPIWVDHPYIVTAVLTPTYSYLIGSRVRPIAQLPDDDLPPRFLSVRAVALAGGKAGEVLNLHGVRLTRDRHEETITCRCRGYTFPHHKGMGKCFYDSLAIAYCNSCNYPCKPDRVDVSLGMTEFWGRRERHTAFAWLSPCCEEECYSDVELRFPYEGEE